MTTIDPELIQYATDHRVRLYLSYTEKDFIDPNRIKVSSMVVPLNKIEPNIKNSGQQVVDMETGTRNQETREQYINWNPDSYKNTNQ